MTAHERRVLELLKAGPQTSDAVRRAVGLPRYSRAMGSCLSEGWVDWGRDWSRSPEVLYHLTAKGRRLLRRAQAAA